MKSVLVALRDVRYAASALALVVIATIAAVVAFSPENDAASTVVGGTPTATAGPSTPVASPTVSYAAVLLDTRRQFDLKKIADALEQFHGRNGSYPSTFGNFSTFCHGALDAGCQLVATQRDLPVDDSKNPYWYRSDGKTYTLFSRLDVTPTSKSCPAEVPPALATAPVLCLSGGQ